MRDLIKGYYGLFEGKVNHVKYIGKFTQRVLCSISDIRSKGTDMGTDHIWCKLSLDDQPEIVKTLRKGDRILFKGSVKEYSKIKNPVRKLSRLARRGGMRFRIFPGETEKDLGIKEIKLISKI